MLRHTAEHRLIFGPYVWMCLSYLEKITVDRNLAWLSLLFRNLGNTREHADYHPATWWAPGLFLAIATGSFSQVHPNSTTNI